MLSRCFKELPRVKSLRRKKVGNIIMGVISPWEHMMDRITFFRFFWLIFSLPPPLRHTGNSWRNRKWGFPSCCGWGNLSKPVETDQNQMKPVETDLFFHGRE